MTEQIPTQVKCKAASLWRRLFTVCYDGVIIFCLFLLFTAIILSLTPDHEIKFKLLYQLLLGSIWFSFFAWFWLHGGQTLGMAAWRLKLVSIDEHPVTFKRVLQRWILAFPAWLCFGLGFFWMLIDKQGMCLYDKWSRTRLIIV